MFTGLITDQPTSVLMSIMNNINGLSLVNLMSINQHEGHQIRAFLGDNDGLQIQGWARIRHVYLYSYMNREFFKI